MKVMGLDFGSRTCGVSISDALLLTAQPVEIIRRERESALRKTLARIDELASENDVRLIVLGLPLNMDTTSGARVTATREFGEKVARRTGLPVVYSDERLTTVEAVRVMNEMNLRGKERKAVVDEIAAVFILQTYLDRMHFKNEDTAFQDEPSEMKPEA